MDCAGSLGFTVTLVLQRALSAPENEGALSWYAPHVSSVTPDRIRRMKTRDECAPLTACEFYGII